MTWRARRVKSCPASRSLMVTPTTRSSSRKPHPLYATLGYEEVPAFNGGRYAEHWLAKPLA